MMLGGFECDEDTAYFLENGRYPLHKDNCKKSNIGSDLLHDRDLYLEFQESNMLEYFDPARTYRYTLWH